jgi:uncharacterized protein with PIN domain
VTGFPWANRSGWIRVLGIAVVLLGVGVVPSRAQENSDCFACHSDRTLTGTRNGKTISVFVAEKTFSESIHGSLTCVSCHTDLDGKELPHAEDLQPVDCGTCHDAEKAQYAESLHGKALAQGDPLAPRCSDCHGKHDILPASNALSTIMPLHIPGLCGKCHREGAPVQRQRLISQDSILQNYSESIHGQGLLMKGLIVAPTCVSCHTAHSVRPHTDPASTIARDNIARTCTKCHAEIEMVHRKIIRGELWEKQAHTLPACVDCHQPHKIRKVYYTQGMADNDCLACHERKTIRASSDGRSLTVNPQELAGSMHVKIACSQCHTEVNASHVRPCDAITKPVDCTACHAEEGTEYQASIHGVLVAQKNPNAPTCKECHGTHGVTGRQDPASLTFPTNVPQLCARCHREGEKAAVRYVGAEHAIIRHYTQSIHGKGLMQSGLTVTAMCTSCHTAHAIRPAADPTSSVNRANIPATCGKCHHGIADQFEASVHSRLVTHTDKELPVCNDCHSAHTIRRTDLAGFKLEIMAQCGRCHEKIASTYFDTYHGKVSRLGYTKTAKCYDCHGAHDILPVTDPRSHVSYQNIVGTCQQCHSGATRRFAGYLTHATHHDPEKYPFLFWTFWGMTSLLIGTFVFSGVHTLLWLPRALQMRKMMRQKPSQSEPPTDATNCPDRPGGGEATDPPGEADSAG